MKINFKWESLENDQFSCNLPFNMELIITPISPDGLLFGWELTDSSMSKVSECNNFKTIDQAISNAEDYFLHELMKFIEVD